MWISWVHKIYSSALNIYIYIYINNNNILDGAWSTESKFIFSGRNIRVMWYVCVCTARFSCISSIVNNHVFMTTRIQYAEYGSLQSNQDQDTANDILNVGLGRVIKGRPEHPQTIYIYFMFLWQFKLTLWHCKY